jgi:hypothetical protein
MPEQQGGWLPNVPITAIDELAELAGKEALLDGGGTRGAARRRDRGYLLHREPENLGLPAAALSRKL